MNLNKLETMKNFVTCLILFLAASWGLPALAATPSVNGSSIPAASSIIDEQSNTWTMVSGVVHKNGVPVGDNYDGNFLLEYDGVFYSRNTYGRWYRWTGSSWPQTSDPRVVSANGASAGIGAQPLVDSGSNVWFLGANGYAYKDGIRAGGSYNVVLVLYHANVIYAENTSGEWYSWNGSAWLQVSGDPRGPSLVQYNSYTSPACPANFPTCTPPFVGNLSVTFTKATTKGNTIWVAATVSDYGGTHAISVTDSQNNTYHELNQANDGSPGAQTLVQFYAENIRGGAATVTVNWSSDNYKGVLAAEIAGTTTSPLVGNNAAIQDGKITPAIDNVSSNNISVNSGGTPSLLVALTMDTNGGASDIGGSGYCAVPAGTGFKQIAQIWSFSPGGQPTCNLATLETKVITGSSPVAGTFTTTHLADPYVTVSAVFH
jgi:hypothetical protein